MIAHSSKVSAFLKSLHLRRKYTLVLDRLSAHRTAVRVLGQTHPHWFEVEWLPAYAPVLNPTEMVCNHTKYADLANFIPEDVHHLRHALTASLEDIRRNPTLLRSFFHRPRLAL